MAGTRLRMGWTDPRTDVFGAHPLFGDILDLNDGVTFTLLDDTFELGAPSREVALAGNVRTQGERATRAIYRHNRQAHAQIILGPMASYADLIANVRTLVRWLDAPPAVPVAVQWQPPTATSPVYLDVVGAAHGIPADEREWLRFQLEPIEIVLLVRPGLRGDRVTLQNLVSNPGFEAGSGPNVVVFNDPLVNTNAYTLVSGAAPSVAGNAMTIPNGSVVAFGSPSWGPVNIWQTRFQFATGLTVNFFLHRTDANNGLLVELFAGQFILYDQIAGTYHNLASAAPALTAGSWYWMVITQFPSAPGMAPEYQATLYADSAGSLGASVATLGPVATFDATSNLSGVMAIGCGGAAAPIGGPKVNNPTLYVGLFGPGGWACAPTTSGATGQTSGAWEQATANTYAGGAVTSYGAARLDLPPAGTVNAFWENYGGGAPAGTSAIPATTGQVLAASVYTKSTGLSAGATTSLVVREWDSNGALLRATTLQSVTGTQAAYTKLSGTVTLGASTAYVSIMLSITDTTAGASANGTVWFDNVQCWNQTTTGQTAMPYCELRFPQSPAHLLVTGLLGDLPAPAHLAWGAFLASWAPGAILTYALGRRGQASANARLAAASVGYTGTALSPTSQFVLDSASYGGYKLSAPVNPSWNPRAFSFPPSDLLGVYHLFCRFQTSQAAGNLANVQTRVVTQQKSNPWFGTIGDADQVGAYNGPYVAPLAAQNTWTLADAGQVNVPALPVGSLTDLTQNPLTPRTQWTDSTAGGSTGQISWQALLPIDGALLAGVVNNPSNAGITVSNQWLWAYHDGLLVNRAAVGDAASATYSVESTPIPNPARGAGGPGTQSTGVINLNSAADPYLTLDPSVAVAATSTAAGGAGVNQVAGVVADQAGAVLPLHCELQYSPLYLYPR